MKKSVKKTTSSKTKSQPQYELFSVSTLIAVLSVIVTVTSSVYIFSRLNAPKAQPLDINEVGFVRKPSTPPVAQNIITVVGTISTSKERQIAENEGNSQYAGFSATSYWLTTADGARYLLKPKYDRQNPKINNVGPFVGKLVAVTGNQGTRTIQTPVTQVITQSPNQQRLNPQPPQRITRNVSSTQLTLTVDTISASN